MRGTNGSTLVWFALALAATSGPVLADSARIEVSLGGISPTNRQLLGQSAFLWTRTSGPTFASFLNNLQSGGSVITFSIPNPETSITDYQRFGYFGRVRTTNPSACDPNLDPNCSPPCDPNFPNDPNCANVLDDTSLIMTFQPGQGVGQTIGWYFPGRQEATLVAALATNNSPDFFSLLNSALINPQVTGKIDLPNVPIAGDTLDLVAFVGGPGGDLGVKVGELSYRIVRDDGDIDGDNDVDLDDLLIALGGFGKCSPDAGFPPNADLDHDGCIDLDDLLFVLGNFGQ